MKVHRAYGLLLALSLAGYPLVASLSLLIGIDSRPVSIAMRILILAISTLLIVLAAARDKTVYYRGWFWTAFLLFWAAYALRMFYETVFAGSSLSKPPLEYWIWGIGASFIPTLALMAWTNRATYRFAVQLALPMLLVAALLVFALGGTEVSRIEGGDYDSGRLRLDALNPISIGHMGVSLILLSLWPVMFHRRRVSTRSLLLALAGTLPGLYLLVAAGSRGPMVAATGALLFHSLASSSRRFLTPILLLLAFGVAGYSLASRFEASGQFLVVARLGAAFAGDDEAVGMRQIAMIGALSQFVDSPIIGAGLEEATTRQYPHNVVIESLMATGLVGAVPFLALIGFSVVAAYRLIKARVPEGWVALIFIQHLIAAQMSGAIYGVTTMWAFLAATISLYMGTSRLGIRPIVVSWQSDTASQSG